VDVSGGSSDGVPVDDSPLPQNKQLGESVPQRACISGDVPAEKYEPSDNVPCRRPEPALALLGRLPRPPRLPVPLCRFFMPASSSSASAGCASKFDVGAVGRRSWEAYGADPGRSGFRPARHQGSICARQDHVWYEYTRTDLNRLAIGQVHAVELEEDTIEDDHATLAPRLGTRAAGEAETGGEEVARVERAVERDSHADPGDGEHAEDRLDRARGGAGPEPLPKLLAREWLSVHGGRCGGRGRVQESRQDADIRRERGRRLKTCGHAPV
jgi:hypothetical protein